MLDPAMTSVCDEHSRQQLFPFVGILTLPSTRMQSQLPTVGRIDSGRSLKRMKHRDIAISQE